MLVFTLVFANFFDAMGTFTGLSRQAGLAGNPETSPLASRADRGGAGAVVGGATSASSTVFIESGTGIGGRPDRTANLVSGSLFLAAMFLAPWRRSFPTEVASAALVIGRGDDVFAASPWDVSGMAVALPVVPHRVRDAVQLFDSQWHRRRFYCRGWSCTRQRQGASDQPAAVGGRRRVRGVFRAASIESIPGF